MATAPEVKEPPRITALRFSTTHGQNIQLEHHGKSSQWNLNCHCGTCCTSRSLQKGEKLNFKLSGSGHVLLGLLSFKPDPASLQNVEITKVEQNAHWTHFRFKKETTGITLSRSKTREVTFSRQIKDKTETNTFDVAGPDLFVFFEIQFGDIVIEMTSDSKKKAICFEKACGSNMNLEEQGKRASLKRSNFSARCCTDRALAPGEVIDLHISPKDGASWTYVKLFVSNQNGSQLQLQNVEVNPDSFLYPPEGIKVDKKGTIQIRLSEAGEVVYSVQTKEARQAIVGPGLDLSRPLYLYVELFRVKVQIESTLPEEEATYLTASSLVEENPYLQPIPDSPPCRTTGFPEVPSQSQSYLPEQEYTEISNVTVDTGQTLPDIFPDPSLTFRKRHDIDGNSSVNSTPDFANKQQHVQKQEDSLDKRPPIPVPKQDQGQFGGGDTQASGPTPAHFFTQGQPTGGSSGPESFEPPSTSIPQDAMSFQLIDRLASHIARVGRLETIGGRNEPTGGPVPVSTFAEKIRTNYVQLLDRLEPDPIADHLFQGGYISDAEQGTFHEKNKKAKSRFVLQILKTRPSTKDTFIIALQQSAQRDLIDLLGLQ